MKEKVRDGEIIFEKVDGRVKLVDPLTNYEGREEIEWQINQRGHTILSGRRTLCPETV